MVMNHGIESVKKKKTNPGIYRTWKMVQIGKKEIQTVDGSEISFPTTGNGCIPNPSFFDGRFQQNQPSLNDGELIPDFERTINRISVLELNHHGFTGFAIAIIT